MGKLIERGAVIKQAKEKKITQKVASIQLGLSERQIRRIIKRYKEEGSDGLIHRNKGKPSRKKLPKEIEAKAIEWLRENGPDFGPTFAQEKLIEYLDIMLSVSTVRSLLIQHCLHKPRKKKTKSFIRRERKHYFGALLQCDGSDHDWFENRADRCVLLTVIDDATGRIEARFSKGESTQGLMMLMRDYVTKYGRPQALYTDHGGPYKVNVGNALGDKKTQLGLALSQLDIRLIYANSPQAKGRIERNHAIHQDRLVKELRLHNISTIESANQYLKDTYLPNFNKQFTVSPANEQNVHRPINGFNMNMIFSIQEKRTMQNDGVVQFRTSLFQVTKNRIYVKPKAKVTVRTHLDGTITLWAGSKQLGYEVIKKKSPKHKKLKTICTIIRKPSNASKAWNQYRYVPAWYFQTPNPNARE